MRSLFAGTTALALAVAGLGGLALASADARADVLDDIQERGVIRVGVKADYPPYGFLDEDGSIVGIEPELAQDVADVLGVELELIPVVSSNRMQFLEQGRIDLMIATMTDRMDRREVVYAVEPNYYSSGTNVLAPAEAGLSEWEELDGLPVCGIQGAFYNRRTEEDFGAEIVAFTGTAEALSALQQGSCIAFVYDDSFIVSRLGENEWADYEMPLPTIDDAPWAIAVQLGEDRFNRFMSGMIFDWHLSGRILELESAFGVDNTPFAERMHEILLDINPSIER